MDNIKFEDQLTRIRSGEPVIMTDEEYAGFCFLLLTWNIGIQVDASFIKPGYKLVTINNK